MSKKYGNFSPVSNFYDKGRKEFTKESIKLCLKDIDKGSTILDLGCGTGIATRQLAKKEMFVVGVDKDKEMIEKALNYKTPNTSYTLGVAEDIPFLDNTFELVVAFSSFHWFINEKSIKEIKRVLKDDGVFCVINKKELSNTKNDFTELAEEFLNKKLPDKHDVYKPKEFLHNFFNEVNQHKFSSTEIFSIDEIITFLKSRSVWNLIPDNLEVEFVKKLKQHYRHKTENNNTIKRNMETTVIVAG